MHNTLLDGRLNEGPNLSLPGRLAYEIREAFDEIRGDPADFFTNLFRNTGANGGRRKAVLRLGLAIALLLDAVLFSAALLLWSRDTHGTPDGAQQRIVLINPAMRSPSANMPRDDKEGSGGGGGGKNSLEPASRGLPPPFFPEHSLIAPTTRATVNPPALPIAEFLLGDPRQNVKRDDLIPTGLINGVIAPPSDGPGTNGGVGNGKNGGVGSNDGPGTGPGNNGGCCGGDYAPGGRRGAAATRVDTQPIALNRPRPNYTEEARKNKVQGVVVARVLVGEDGRVKQVLIVNGLADGLNEEAIRAASQIHFKPASKNGAAVAYWIRLEIEFNMR